MNANNWKHFAVVKDKKSVKLYLNGRLVGTKNLESNKQFKTLTLNIHLRKRIEAFDELRISKIARWTANFVPPTVDRTMVGL